MIQLALIIPGVLLGSLLNALADDLPHRSRPRLPHCPACGSPYLVSQWVALIALIAGRWRCRQCQARQQWRKLGVEIVSAVMLVFVFQHFGFTLKSILLGVLLECLLLITIIDFEHRLILYMTIFPAALVALTYGVFGAALEAGPALTKTLIGGAVGFGVYYLVYLLGLVYSAWTARRQGAPLEETAFGGGDVNLGGVVGLAVGWPGILFVIVYATFAGGIAATLHLLLMRLRNKDGLLSPIPYGPFIVFGAVVVLLFSAEIKHFYGVGP